MKKKRKVKNTECEQHLIECVFLALDERLRHHCENVAQIGANLLFQAAAEGYDQSAALTEFTKVEWEQCLRYYHIGMLFLPSSILDREGELSDIELQAFRNHTQFGFQVIGRSMSGQESENSPIHMSAAAAFYHHEHWDGSGYPEGRKASAIPLPARICTLADDYCRYVLPLSPGSDMFIDGVKKIISGSGCLYDPNLVRMMFKSLPADILDICGLSDDGAEVILSD